MIFVWLNNSVEATTPQMPLCVAQLQNNRPNAVQLVGTVRHEVGLLGGGKAIRSAEERALSRTDALSQTERCCKRQIQFSISQFHNFFAHVAFITKAYSLLFTLCRPTEHKLPLVIKTKPPTLRKRFSQDPPGDASIGALVLDPVLGSSRVHRRACSQEPAAVRRHDRSGTIPPHQLQPPGLLLPVEPVAQLAGGLVA